MDVRRVVGRNVRRVRLDRGLTQEELAHDAEIAPSYLSQIESGKRNPTVNLLQTLAATLRIPIVEFFSEARLPTSKGLPRGHRQGR